MGKTAVIYSSQTGFTRRYAQWIAEAAAADCFTVSEAKGRTLEEYDTIVFGGWACAGGVSKLRWFRGNLHRWRGKKLIAFCVGASPMESPEIANALRQNFGGPEFRQVSAFYCPGGLNYEKMPVPSRLMMKLFVKTLRAKKDQTEYDREMIGMLSASYDLSDRNYMEPILERIRR